MLILTFTKRTLMLFVCLARFAHNLAIPSYDTQNDGYTAQFTEINSNSRLSKRQTPVSNNSSFTLNYVGCFQIVYDNFLNHKNISIGEHHDWDATYFCQNQALKENYQFFAMLIHQNCVIYNDTFPDKRNQSTDSFCDTGCLSTWQNPLTNDTTEIVIGPACGSLNYASVYATNVESYISFTF